MDTKDADNERSNGSPDQTPQRGELSSHAEAVESDRGVDGTEGGIVGIMDGEDTAVICVAPAGDVVEGGENSGALEDRGMTVEGAEEDENAGALKNRRMLEEAVGEDVEAGGLWGDKAMEEYERVKGMEAGQDRALGEDEKAGDVELTDNGEDVEMAEVEETGVVEKRGSVVGRKRKRRRNGSAKIHSKTHAVSMKKTVGEDVCYICLDGGDLFLCDHRGCPKAYHPPCVNREEEYFKPKDRWNCGWHFCSICKKNSYYMCYTCPFSLCKACIKDGVIFCVRGNRGFCETCMKFVRLIEHNDQETIEPVHVNFDDKSSWNYLFKDYWLNLKETLSITYNEICQAKYPSKGSKVSLGRQELHDDLSDAYNDGGSKPDIFSKNVEVNSYGNKKAKKRFKVSPLEDKSSGGKMVGGETCKDLSEERAVNVTSYIGGNSKWASKELLEFVMHVGNGDKTVRSQFEVRALLVEYIVKNKLRDTSWKSQINCDFRLQKLFRKLRVCHFEMFNLLESHFVVKSQDDDPRENVVTTKTSQQGDYGGSDTLMERSKEMKQKNHRKDDEKRPPENRKDYAVIDMHNMNLIFLRRNCLEELLGDVDSFHDKVVGSFVRITVPGSQNKDLCKLVQVVGTKRTAGPYKAGKGVTDIELEISNLNKVELVSIDAISNQEFTEDECMRLRQSINCGLIDRLTVGDILNKAMALQAVRVNSLLKPPEDRQQKLEIPEIHTDKNTNPCQESEEDEDKTDENYFRPISSVFARKIMDLVSSRSVDNKHSFIDQDLNKNLSADLLKDGNDEDLSNQGRDGELQSTREETLKLESVPLTCGRHSHISEVSEIGSNVVPKSMSDLPAAGVVQSMKINDLEKQWCYLDPNGKIQGPFSMAQLRKWSKTYFPSDLRIWRTTQKGEEMMLLTDALVKKLHKELSVVVKSAQNADSVHGPNCSAIDTGKLHCTSSLLPKDTHESESGFSSIRPSTPIEKSRHCTLVHGTDCGVRDDLSNLPPQISSSDDEKEQSYYISALAPDSTSPEPDRSLMRLEGKVDCINVLNTSQVLDPEGKHSQSIMPSESQEAHTITSPHPATDYATNTIPAAEMRNPSERQQNSLVTLPTQPQAYCPWGSASSSTNDSASPGLSGSFALPAVTTVLPSESWRPAGSGHETNGQPPMPANRNLCMGLTDNLGASSRQENPNTNWGPIPGNSNLGQKSPQLGDSNMHWGDSTQVSAAWGVNVEMPSPGQLPAPDSAIPCWVPSNLLQQPVNANSSLAQHPQWRPPGNPNPGSAPTWRSGMYENEQHNDDSFQSKGDRFSHGKGRGYGSGKLWNRQSSFGSGSKYFSKPFAERRRICIFHEKGYCKKGASCNYLHA